MDATAPPERRSRRSATRRDPVSPRRPMAVLVTVLATATLAGCGGTRNTDAHPGTTAARPPQLSDAQHLRIADAQQRLIAECMRGKGFRYREPARPNLEESRTFGYVTDDVAWARKHGYGSRIRAEEDRARRTNPNLAYRLTLSPPRRAAYDAALDGGTDAPVLSAELPSGATVRKRVGGCAAAAEERLYGDPATWFRLEKTVDNLQPLYVPKVLADKRFSAAVAAWSRCMRRVGHPFDSPAAVRAAALRPDETIPAGAAFRRERALAVADATCARNTSLKAIGTERETHYVDLLRDRYGTALDAHARRQREALRRAMAVVGPRT
ncbi:hypothetical protein ACFYO5_11845 [Streptomyces sp. NPDC006259]|uniref:hypothetical protein n=1 Tax=Streptomyces sp. NPDC006259 TaxID=3364740 RepID=UPI00368DA9CF